MTLMYTVKDLEDVRIHIGDQIYRIVMVGA